jgi:hypothetical protein
MAQCERHPERLSAAECARCGRQLCGECIEAKQEDLAFCYECAVGLEVDGFRAKDELRQETSRKKARRRISVAVIVAAAVIAALVAGEAVFLFASRGARGRKANVTAAQEVVWKRDDCLMSMQRARTALEDYRLKNNAYPDSLEPVKTAGIAATCPLSGAEYRFARAGSGYSLSCPNPEKHGVRQILSSDSGIPRNEK